MFLNLSFLIVDSQNQLKRMIVFARSLSLPYHGCYASSSPLFALESRLSARLLSGFLPLSYYTALPTPLPKTEAMRIARSCVCKSAPVCCCLSRLAESIVELSEIHMFSRLSDQ